MLSKGQKVVYIMRSVPELGLINGRVYKVYDVMTCNCPALHIDVGIKHNKAFCYCEDCECITNIDERYFLHSIAFRPVVEISAELSIAVKDYLPDNYFI